MEAEELLKYMLNFFQDIDKQLNNKNEELKRRDVFSRLHKYTR